MTSIQSVAGNAAIARLAGASLLQTAPATGHSDHDVQLKGDLAANESIMHRDMTELGLARGLEKMQARPSGKVDVEAEQADLRVEHLEKLVLQDMAVIDVNKLNLHMPANKEAPEKYIDEEHGTKRNPARPLGSD